GGRGTGGLHELDLLRAAAPPGLGHLGTGSGTHLGSEADEAQDRVDRFHGQDSLVRSVPGPPRRTSRARAAIAVVRRRRAMPNRPAVVAAAMRPSSMGTSPHGA